MQWLDKLTGPLWRAAAVKVASLAYQDRSGLAPDAPEVINATGAEQFG